MLKSYLIGYLGGDAVVTEINGKNVIKFSIAYNERVKAGDQTIKKDPIWINCTIWKEKGENLKIAEFLKKGQLVYVEGTPKAGTYAKEGISIAVLNLTVYNIRLLGSSENKKNEPTANMGSVKIENNSIQSSEENLLSNLI